MPRPGHVSGVVETFFLPELARFETVLYFDGRQPLAYVLDYPLLQVDVWRTQPGGIHPKVIEVGQKERFPLYYITERKHA